MTKLKTLSVKIPFSGFYESSHNAEIDRAVESYFDLEGDGENHVPEDFYWSFDEWHTIHIEYAKLYTKRFAQWFEGETGIELPIEFDEMQSPREYNFETDRIFARIPLQALRKVKAYVPHDVLAAQIKERCTSRSGFISWYSNEIAYWKAKPFATWDHNELGILIEAALIHAGVEGEGYEYDIMEPAVCNGRIDDIVTPYLNEWVKEHPLENAEDKIKQFFDIPDEEWQALDEEAKERKLSEYQSATYHCEQTPELFPRY